MPSKMLSANSCQLTKVSKLSIGVYNFNPNFSFILIVICNKKYEFDKQSKSPND